MIALLDPVRSVIKPEYREKFYNVTGATVVVLGTLGIVDGNAAATVAQLVLAVVALGFAILYSTSSLRMALYGVLVAVQAVFAFWSIGNDATWAAIVSMAAAVLGTQVAAGRTPAPFDLGEQLPEEYLQSPPWKR